MTLDSLRTAAAERRAKMQTPGEPDCSYHGLDGCDEAEAALDEALAMIDKLVAAGEAMAEWLDEDVIPDPKHGRSSDRLDAWRALLAEMGK